MNEQEQVKDPTTRTESGGVVLPRKKKTPWYTRLIRVAAVVLLCGSLLYALLTYLTHGDPSFQNGYYMLWMKGLTAGGGCYSDSVSKGSKEAVELAVADGNYNVKLDVVLKDGVLVTDYEGSLPLKDLLPLTGEGKCGLIVQINGGGQAAAETLCTLLTDTEYQGHVAVQSWDTHVLTWLKDNRPGVLRGLVTGRLTETSMDGFDKFLHRNGMKNYTCRPHYMVFDSDCLPSAAAKILRGEMLILAGNVADLQEITRLADATDGYILENFAFNNP